MRRKKTFGSIMLVVTGLIMLCLMSACAAPTPTPEVPTGKEPAEKEPIKVGILDCYSGAATTYTYDVRDAFKMAVEDINKEGVLGREIEFTTRDTKFKVDVGLSMAKELVMKENVDILVGTISSSVALAVSDYCKTEKIPFFATFAKSAKITGAKGHHYVFSTNENTAMAGKAAGVVLADEPYTKYWIAGDDYEYGHSIADGVWSNLKERKPEVELVGESWWKVGEPDFTPYITSILGAKPDMAIIATGGADCVPFLKAAKTTGFHEEVPFFMHTATELATLRPLGEEAPENVVGSSNYYFYYPETSENEAFVDKFRSAYDRYPNAGALYGYITAEFIAKGFRDAGEMDTEKFIDALEGLSVDSPVGTVEMRPYDHQVMLPMFIGTTTKVPEYDFLIAKDIETIPAEEVMPPVEDIKKARE